MRSYDNWHARLAMGLLAALLAVACTQAQPTPSPIPSPSATPPPAPTPSPTTVPTPTATAAPTQTPLPTATPIPTLQPTPVRERNANLAPFRPRSWTYPLVAAPTLGSQRVDVLSVDSDTYISWAVGNDALGSVDYPFFVDVYLDGVLAERWSMPGLGADEVIALTDWEKLKERIRLDPGSHTLRLVVDPTDLVPELDENDNVYEVQFTWEAPSEPAATPAAPPNRLPDLAPAIPDGWTDSLIATSYSGDRTDGPLSVNVPTYISYGFRNEGLASFEERSWVYLYLDDVLVSAQVGVGLLAEETVGSAQWVGLLDSINLTPGVHKLRLELDATNLIEEADESNNSIEKLFMWGQGAVAPMTPGPTPTPRFIPEPLTLPNLVPGWRLDWDGPIMVSHELGTFRNSPLTTDMVPHVDVVVHNESTVAATLPFTVDLYLDGALAHSFDFEDAMHPNALWWSADWDGLGGEAGVTPGEHTLRMVIDPDNRVVEANEADNEYEVTLSWISGPLPEPSPTTYTQDELRAMLSDLQELVDNREPVLEPGVRDNTGDVLRVAEAGYYLLTGTSLRDERVDVYLLNQREYIDWIDDHYIERLALTDGADRAAILVERDYVLEHSGGLKLPRYGKIAVAVDAERGMAEVIGSLMHELGHMRQSLLNPNQGRGTSSRDPDALKEAQAQQFERAFWLEMERFTGLELLSFPDHPGLNDLISFGFDTWFAEPDVSVHTFGFLIQWLSVLGDPNLVHLKEELTSQGRLGRDASLELYDYLVALPAESVEAYVQARAQSIPTHGETIKEIATSRLVSDLHPDREGSPSLREMGLLAP
ncbi:MAG: hypothetical protein OYI31_01050 [Chloroflexota bacterium]|nr:hypothetical protein [Chloroflexota bacterium]MDE2941156.1 hypothetical protein [Chloroflexota bacterium]MDE3267035.1 hypothetical protein [Chloroflexota bacterium]